MRSPVAWRPLRDATIRCDSGPGICAQAFVDWRCYHGIEIRHVQPGKPDQNAYIESFSSRFRDECLNEHWFLNIRHARTIIEGWRKEYNEERPKKGLGGLTPSQYARRLATKSDTVTARL